MSAARALQPAYSGPKSQRFWHIVAKLPKSRRGELYFAGVLLQNMEETVLRVLKNARARKPRKRSRR